MVEMGDPLARVVVAISAFRSDLQVMTILEKIFQNKRCTLASVIVVDSLSDGTLQQSIKSAGWPVLYENADRNLGSAGNLARRLELAANMGADWCFTINHDGMFDRKLVETLALVASQGTNIGAVYPKRVWLDRGGTSLKPHTHVFNMPVHTGPIGAQALEEVAWDSSNGALYGLEPVRQGVKVWADLWYGWEDLAYGWQLTSAGWKQYLCADVVYLDDYEYHHVSLLKRRFFITRKPSWTSYYVIRNLLLIVRRTGNGPRAWVFFTKRFAREVLFALMFRDAKVKRLGLICQGFADGLAGKTGKGKVP
jgi:GT2 family glycosyltransferase